MDSQARMSQTFRGVMPTALLLCLLVQVQANCAPALANLKDLSQIEKRLAAAYSAQHLPATKRQLAVIRKELEGAPVKERATVLRRLAEATKWGTPERAAAYYVCAWYGVKYERCRDYLLNCFFWIERGFYRRYGKQPPPFCWAEDTVPLLYELYEHNHDFRLLHELVTGHSDGCGAEALHRLRIDSLTNHPRGVLHVTRISEQARRFALDVLSDRFYSREQAKDMKRAKTIFAASARRVAADPEDPLRTTARRLLNEASELHK